MKTTIVVLIVAFSLPSCRHKDSAPTGPSALQETIADYFPMTDGNYWVYQEFESDSSLVFTPTMLLDSLSVEKDTVAWGITYKRVNSSLWGPGLLRDSSGYLVNGWGDRQFTVNQTGVPLLRRYDFYPDTNEVVTSVMMKSDSVSVVPAGQFQARYVLGTVTSTSGATFWSGTRYFFRAYSKGVGMVCRRLMWVTTGTYLEYRLVRYHLNAAS